MSEKAPRIKFGNWLPTGPTYVGPLSYFGWGILVVGILVAVMSSILGNLPFGLLIVSAAMIFLLFFNVRFGELDAGRSLASRIGERMNHAGRNMAGETAYATGLFSELPSENLTALPGALVQIEELDGLDGTGHPYTLLHHRAVRLISATMTSVPDGTELLPQEMKNTQVSRFGAWVASLSRDSAVAGATVTIDSAYSSKAPLVRKLHSEISPAAPIVAQRALLEATQLLPNRHTETHTYGTVVWSVPKLGESVEEAAAEVAAKLPYHRQGLYAAGAGLPMTADSHELARMMRVAYQPMRSSEHGSDELAGHDFTMRLVDAGPDYFDESQRRVVFHDGVASMTAMMTIPPRMHITEDTFKELFAPADKFLRKRVTVFYRPLSSAEAQRVAQKLRKSAGVQATSKGQQSSFDEHKKKLAQKTESELVEGASMTTFSLMVTVTFEANEKAYRAATTQLKSLLEATNLSYRFVERGTSAAFHSTLPLGVLPWMYKSTFATLMGE
ncbi:SCO6880 family protein [Agromyces neolithicus]|uniref:Integral membrane protein n=1 Tax=Agromyces neolithicus TaxID=269420 RepID=A0ABP4YLY9_9MICO